MSVEVLLLAIVDPVDAAAGRAHAADDIVAVATLEGADARVDSAVATGALDAKDGR